MSYNFVQYTDSYHKSIRHAMSDAMLMQQAVWTVGEKTMNWSPADFVCLLTGK